MPLESSIRYSRKDHPLGNITKKATINAPTNTVFKYVSDPHNAPNYISSITRVTSGPEGAPQVGQTWQSEANFLGKRGHIRLRLTDLQPNRSVRFVIQGEPQAALEMHLHPTEDT